MKIFTFLLAINMMFMPVQEPKAEGYIFIGDSRTVGMEASLCEEQKENAKFIATVGIGINLLDDIEEQINQIIDADPDKDWKIVCNLGVNDLGNAEKYAKKYQELSNQYHNFYVVSVNPVIENGTHYATNEKIDYFNNLMKQQDFVYIDTNNEIISDFYSSDGLHYDNETYQRIFQIIMSNLDKKQNKVVANTERKAMLY